MASYTTMLTKSVHPELRARYRRSNKRNAMTQVGRIERIQANTRKFGREDTGDGRRRLTRVGWDEENEYGFIDPAYVLRDPRLHTEQLPFALHCAGPKKKIIITKGPTVTCPCASGVGYQVLISKPYRESSAPAAATGSEPEPTEEGTERGSESGYEINVDLEARREAGDSDGDAQGGDEDDEWDDGEEEDKMGMEDGADAVYFG
ncbi:hypothetical protein EXIGLDRAFT_829709 [Exidia glandulosa HHB12029]|uniref:Uncharacterized protein n=1 Tax=Exidia glandulosa HHB12029 TaxID=1314781 RepID=A0A165P7S7_EXIGL|nr:hypothetical protein EXIGLDRAFT_829709 [Exidia glandulosa HHB12029]